MVELEKRINAGDYKGVNWNRDIEDGIYPDHLYVISGHEVSIAAKEQKVIWEVG